MIRSRRVATILLGMAMAVASPIAAASQNAARDVAPGAYTLDAGDRVRIIVYGEEQMTGEYNVTSAGDVSFPLIGDVPATGRTIGQLQDAIRARLAAGYIKQPRVSVEVIDYRPFFILGEVTKPGQYPYASGMTVQQAVATAGGFTYRASTRKVFIKHAGAAAEAEVSLRTDQLVPVRPGDTVRVGERFF